MAVYKVPQDVEADDKLIGPFNFRQFIYLIIVVAAIAIAWVLGQLFIPLAIIPLPIIVFFGALALPLRKDQPMETYLAAIVSFYLKPHMRLWSPDGVQSLIEIIAPKTEDIRLTKEYSQYEAERRLSYLANVVDSRGWSVRGVSDQTYSAVNPDVYNEALATEDIFDEGATVSHNIDSQLGKANERHHKDLLNRMHQSQPAISVQQHPETPPLADPYASLPQPQAVVSPEPIEDLHLNIDPYPSMQQSMVQPVSSQPQPQIVQPVPTLAPQPIPAQALNPPSEERVTPDIMNLANNPDLSIETIAREANRIKQRQALPDDEVIVSLH